MRYSHPQIRQVAQRIPLLCATYFVVFAYLFLRVLQSDILAQAQFQMSEGTDVYHPVVASMLSTLLLLILGLFVSRLLFWLPLRAKASVWFLPFLLLGALTHWHFPAFGDDATSVSWPVYAMLLSAYAVWLFWCSRFRDSYKANATFATYAWPNALQLVVFTAVCVSVANTDIGIHRTLRANRYVHERSYEKALKVARWERHPLPQLSAATALALSETGTMGEKLFLYSHPYGSEGLLPQPCDTLMCYNLPRAAGFHLGYKRSDRTPATLFLEVASTMPKARPAMRDYLLGAYLLDRNLVKFRSLLLSADRLSLSMPRHYREALVLYDDLYSSSQEALGDSLMSSNYREFQTLLNATGTKDERELQCRKRFGTTYWCYFFFN